MLKRAMLGLLAVVAAVVTLLALADAFGLGGTARWAVAVTAGAVVVAALGALLVAGRDRRQEPAPDAAAQPSLPARNGRPAERVPLGPVIVPAPALSGDVPAPALRAFVPPGSPAELVTRPAAPTPVAPPTPEGLAPPPAPPAPAPPEGLTLPPDPIPEGLAPAPAPPAPAAPEGLAPAPPPNPSAVEPSRGPSLDLAAATPGEIRRGVASGEQAVVELLVEQGDLTSAGPLTDRDVQTMVFVAIAARDLIDALLGSGQLAGAAPLGALSHGDPPARFRPPRVVRSD
jgi:hypothetical protein